MQVAPENYELIRALTPLLQEQLVTDVCQPIGGDIDDPIGPARNNEQKSPTREILLRVVQTFLPSRIACRISGANWRVMLGIRIAPLH